MASLKNLVVCITGGTKGIGRAIAESFLQEEAHVVICARYAEEVTAAVNDMKKGAEGQASGVACDVRELKQVRAFLNHAVLKFGGVDVLVNNAGVGNFGAVDQLQPERWREVIDTNLTGVYYGCHEVVPIMKKRGSGFIINIGSLAGKNAFAGGAAYNASKFGLIGFSEALMLDVRYYNIRVSYVMPGSVNTAFGGDAVDPAANWMISPKDIADMVIHLVKVPPNTMVSRVEMRPTMPPRKS